MAGAALLGSISAAAAAGTGAAAAAAAVAGGALRGALPGLPWAELDSAAAGAQGQLPGITALAGLQPYSPILKLPHNPTSPSDRMDCKQRLRRS